MILSITHPTHPRLFGASGARLVRCTHPPKAINDYYDDKNDWSPTRRQEEKTKLRRTRGAQGTRNAAKILLPAHVEGNHWTLIVIRPAAKTIRLYDPLGNKYEQLMDRVLQWMTEMDPDAKDEGTQGWQKHTDRMPRQANDTDCGVMVCLALRRLMLRNSRPRTLEQWGYQGAHGTRGRYRIINDLAANKIIEARDWR